MKTEKFINFIPYFAVSLIINGIIQYGIIFIFLLTSIGAVSDSTQSRILFSYAITALVVYILTNILFTFVIKKVFNSTGLLPIILIFFILPGIVLVSGTYVINKYDRYKHDKDYAKVLEKSVKRTKDIQERLSQNITFEDAAFKASYETNDTSWSSSLPKLFIDIPFTSSINFTQSEIDTAFNFKLKGNERYITRNGNCILEAEFMEIKNTQNQVQDSYKTLRNGSYRISLRWVFDNYNQQCAIKDLDTLENEDFFITKPSGNFETIKSFKIRLEK